MKSRNCDVLMTYFLQENRVCLVLNPIEYWWERLEMGTIGKRMNILWSYTEVSNGSRYRIEFTTYIDPISTICFMVIIP
jgi:hypothetical protein